MIAEASRRISDETKQNNPQISWVEIRGMPNRLVHEYDDIDLEIVSISYLPRNFKLNKYLAMPPEGMCYHGNKEN